MENELDLEEGKRPELITRDGVYEITLHRGVGSVVVEYPLMINGLVPSEGTVITSLSINGERMLKGWIEETVDFPDWLGGPAFKTATIEVTGHNRNEGCPASVEIHGEELLGSDEGPTLSLVR